MGRPSAHPPSGDDALRHSNLVDERQRQLDNLQQKKDNYEPYDEQKDADGNVIRERDSSPEAQEAKDELSAAHKDVTNTGEDFGEAAADDMLAQHYGVNPDQIQTFNGSGVFDKVVELDDGRIIIVEAKGPNADLGARRDLNGDLVQQGTREYMESILDNMRRNGPDEALAARIKAALEDGDVEYLEVKPSVREVVGPDGQKHHVYAGYNRRKFHI